MSQNNKQNTTTMCYEGAIDMQLKIKGKVYNLDMHNEGTAYLKYIFAKAMLNDLDKWNTPGYITIVKLTKDGEEQAFIDIDIAISGSQLVDPSSEGYPTAVTFTSYISYDALAEPVDAASTDTFYIYLLSFEDTSYYNVKHKLARFNVKPGVLSYITPGTTATLNWTMRIINKNEE